MLSLLENNSNMPELCYENSAIRNSKWGKIKSKLQESQSKSDLNEKGTLIKSQKNEKVIFKNGKNHRESGRSRR